MDYSSEYNKISSEIRILKLPKPALRALINANIYTLEQLSAFPMQRLIELHGMGPNSVKKITALLSTI